ncbi:hypothetical protein SAMN05444397_11266 [Flavobacterium aquidurense]|uniref:PrgI family protein n=1 Tax=Flavobacterium frigidimaris TaxID=262320 RepID=A0ABX4BJZ0_FLAFR|nr:hypothetical protein [Flavobacterium frigidimaris]OXA75918.1 hypothetical protein B0A65_20410 [Flavobacterium frigidimaris]SDZ64016.1 hypothetical protein SAMN05444397_11266 [Flavobacterium aquidurense]
MENIFNTENMANLGETVEKKISAISPNTLLCAGAGSLFLAATLKLAGKGHAGSFFGKWAIPLLAIGCYKKYSDFSNSKTNNDKEEEKGIQTDYSIAST